MSRLILKVKLYNAGFFKNKIIQCRHYSLLFQSSKLKVIIEWTDSKCLYHFKIIYYISTYIWHQLNIFFLLKNTSKHRLINKKKIEQSLNYIATNVWFIWNFVCVIVSKYGDIHEWMITDKI